MVIGRAMAGSGLAKLAELASRMAWILKSLPMRKSEKGIEKHGHFTLRLWAPDLRADKGLLHPVCD